MTAVRSIPGLLRGACKTVGEFATRCIGPDLSGETVDPDPPTGSTWILPLCLSASIAVLLIAAGQGAGRRGGGEAPLLFWSGVVLLLVPSTSRIAFPIVSRGERLWLLLLLGEALFFYKLLYSPTGFVQFDEFLHWITAHDILYRHKLFLRNPLLPVSAYYPALELVTAALADVTRLGLFPAAVLVLAVLRATFIVALFLFFERISRSARTAALACLVYMGCANFIVFDAMFAYESLGVVSCILVLLIESSRRRIGDAVPVLTLTALLLAGLAVTHHVSSFVCAFYLSTLLAIEALRCDRPAARRRRLSMLAAAAGLSILLPLLWAYLQGGAISGYIGPVVERGVADLLDKFHGGSGARRMFVAADGSEQPIGYRVVGIASTLLIAAGLATGFFRSLAVAAGAAARSGWPGLLPLARRQWRDSRVLLLAFAAFGFPVSVALRLSPGAWEIGNRMGAFVYVAVGFVVAVGIVHFWQSRPTPWKVVATGLALSTVVLGGITTGSAGRAIRGPYRVAADPESVEPMGIETAKWTRKWLGEGNRFAADRVNRTLLATYGQQDIVTTIADAVDESRVFLGDTLAPDTLYPIRKGSIDYLLVDLRLTTSLPVLGEYFEPNDAAAGKPPPSRLLKFDKSESVGRIFDNGWIVLYDVRGMHDD